MSETTVPVRSVPMAQPWFGRDEVAAVTAVIESGWVAQGTQVRDFEDAFARKTTAAHAVAVSNCTTALHLGLVLAGVTRDDEVVVPSLSFVATANAVRYVGATPVFAEVDPATHNVTPASVEEVVTARTRAVIVVDQCGVPADLDPIAAFCRDRDIAVVQDAACSLGSLYHGTPTGGDADFAAFSFHPRKLVVTGEGGMITTSREDWAARLRRLRQHAMSVSPFERHVSDRTIIESYDETGYNYRMTDMQAALGLVQLTKLDQMVQRRRQLAASYHHLLDGIPGLTMVSDPSHGRSNFQTFWAVLPDDFPVPRNDMLSLLQKNGVQARHGVTAAHLEPAFADLAPQKLPETERISQQAILLPMFHELVESDQELIADIFHAAADGRIDGGRV